MDASLNAGERPRRRQLIPAIIVASVAVLAVLAAAMHLKGPDDLVTSQGVTLSGDTEGRPQRPLDAAVVRAPPIEAPATNVAGGPPASMACRHCGVIEAVAAQDNNTRFQIRVRMDDGSIRTLEQPVPFMAGSRVTVQGGTVRPAPARASQG